MEKKLNLYLNTKMKDRNVVNAKVKGRISGMDYLSLGLCAFGGLGMEAVYAFGLEPVIYGAPMQEWTMVQTILHWILTCITWGIFAVVLVRKSGTKYAFPLMEKGAKLTWVRVVLCLLFIAGAFGVSYTQWGGFKVYLEYAGKGLLMFAFQYLYYVFETMLFLLIVVFGQKACEVWFHKENFPYGGLICGMTWGLGHIFTKDFLTGITSLCLGVALGSVYLVVNRDLRKAYVVMFLMFVL